MSASSLATLLPFEPAAPLIHSSEMPVGEIARGIYVVRLARTKAEVDAALRLRFTVFNLEQGEGLARSFITGHDEDELDLTCDHLILIDRSRNQVIGTCRLRTYEIAKTIQGFCSSTEFDLATLPLDVHQNAIEVSRACIAKPHRNTPAVLLLWQGVARYSLRNQKRYLFGRCPVSSQDPTHGGRLFELLSEEGYLHPQFRLSVRPGFKCLWYKINGPDPRTLRVPHLLRTYLRFGAKLCGLPALDRQFRTINFFLLIDLHALDRRVQRVLFGPTEERHDFARSAQGRILSDGDYVVTGSAKAAKEVLYNLPHAYSQEHDSLWLLRTLVAHRLAPTVAGGEHCDVRPADSKSCELGKSVIPPVTSSDQTPTPTRSVLVIEDDRDIAESLRYSLELEHFETRIALTGEDGLAAALDSKRPPSVILLDLLLPGINGFEICRRLRREPLTLLTPIIMLTARASPSEIATGLAAGANEYMTKPFSVREVIERIDALLRRIDKTSEIYDDGKIRFDFKEMLVVCDGVATSLNNLEFVLLAELAAHPGTVATRQQLIDKLWGAGHYGDARIVDVYIQRLRAVLKSCGQVIESATGDGYRFVGAATDCESER